jgi:hypothetical protein
MNVRRRRERRRFGVERALVLAGAALAAALGALSLGGSPACVVQAAAPDAGADVGAEAAIAECDISGDCDTCQACMLMYGGCHDELVQCENHASCQTMSACERTCDFTTPASGGGGSGGGGSGGGGGFDVGACKRACCDMFPGAVRAYEAAQICVFGDICPISCVNRLYSCE